MAGAQLLSTPYNMAEGYGQLTPVELNHRATFSLEFGYFAYLMKFGASVGCAELCFRSKKEDYLRFCKGVDA